MKWVANGTADGGAHYIRGVVMGGFAELVGGAGGDPVALAEKAGFSRDVLSEPDGLISWARLGVLMDLAAEEIGVRRSASMGGELPSHFPNVGPVALMATSSRRRASGSRRSSSIGAIIPTPHHATARRPDKLPHHLPLPQRVAGAGHPSADGVHARDRMPDGARHERP